MPGNDKNSQKVVIFEATTRCNHQCSYCYNFFADAPRDSHKELDTEKTTNLIRKIIEETQCQNFTFSGGEPLLRKDILDLIKFVSDRGVKVTLITNGSLLDDGLIEKLMAAGIKLFELPLLSFKRETHNFLSQANSFDNVTEAITSIKLKGGIVGIVFVGTKKNFDDFEKTLKLAKILGADAVLLNRFNAGGRGIKNLRDLQPSLGQVRNALEIAYQNAPSIKISVSCGIPMQPCLFDLKKYQDRIGFGFCSAGKKNAYYTFDPIGNVRLCNHTPDILCNIFQKSFYEISRPEKINYFLEAYPEFCLKKKCPQLKVCQGGCKAAAQVCFGSLEKEEPFLKENLDSVDLDLAKNYTPPEIWV